MDKIYSIGELAKTCGTTPRAVRLYIDKDLLQPTRVGRMHCFSEQSSKTLARILRLKRLGFSLDEIKACQGRQDVTALTSALGRIERLAADAEDEMAEIRHTLGRSSNRR